MKATTEMKRQLEQIFLYLTLQCDSRCITCYMHKHYSNPRQMPFQKAKEYIQKYRSWGAKKLTLLGGEPTLYPHLAQLVKFAKDIGYSHVRIQTNGQFDSTIFIHPSILENVDTFCFSVDGHTEALNYFIRAGCSLNKTLENMRFAKQLGYDVRTNTTITSVNIDHIFDIVNVVENNGSSVAYLNVVFSMGAALNHPYLIVYPKQWINTFDEIKKHSHKFRAKVKVPIGYIVSVPIDHCCIAFKMLRLYVMPNGDAYPCILFVDQPKLQVDACPYSHKLISYTYATYEEMSKYCYFLSVNKDSLKPSCLYYRKVFGGRYDNTWCSQREKNTSVKGHTYA